jgi:hypothetical protein
MTNQCSSRCNNKKASLTMQYVEVAKDETSNAE